MRDRLGRRFARRDRILNVLHKFHLAAIGPQTLDQELDCLQRHAAHRTCAIEVGVAQGSATVRILRGMHPDGVIYCVDPWLPRNNCQVNPSGMVFFREMLRAGLLHRAVIVGTTLAQAEKHLPAQFDFMFMDGPHSWEGTEEQWSFALRRLAIGGIVCLHDTAPCARSSTLESFRYFKEVIARDPRFTHLESCVSLSVLRREAL